MTPILAAALLLGQPQTASRFDLGVRLKALEAAWMSSSPEAKRKAVAPITSSVMSFFSGTFGAACQNLDQARSLLIGRPLTAGDALTLRQDPSSIGKGEGIVLTGTWAYAPSGAGEGLKTVIEAGGRRFEAVYPDTVRVELPSGSIIRDNGALRLRVGGQERRVVADRLPDLEQRLEKLKNSAEESVAPLHELIVTQMNGKSETDVSLAPVMTLAEGLASKKISSLDVREWPLAKEDRTYFRASFPEKMDEDETLVIALHGAGGSENLFYEGYGLGLAVKESLKRGWAFASPRSAPSASRDVIAWMKRVRNWSTKRVVIMGHSMGGALALQSGSLSPRPSAVALFAPAGRSVPPNLVDVPLFLAVGRQEIMMLGASAESIKKQIAGSKGFKHLLADPCEHLMIVAEALPEAFKWLDQALKD